MDPKNKNSGADFEKDVDDLYDTPPAPKDDDESEDNDRKEEE